MFGFANPKRFEDFSKVVLVIASAAAILLIAAGLYLALAASPPDYQMSESVRIMYIHVPSAWLAMAVYASLSVAALSFLIWKHTLAGLYIRAAAPIGAAFTAVCLISGALWGQPSWGTWWVWDARLTSELILLFLYLGFICLEASIEDRRRADRAAAVLAVVGVINVPIIYFSVVWWNTLHQGASVSLTSSPTMARTMLVGMLLMVGAFWSYAIAVVLVRVRCIIRERERGALWLSELRERQA